MLTNRMGLPQSIVRAVMNDPYTRGSSDISVTQLISPPYQRKLKETVEPVEDASDRIWALLGQATHTILERAYPPSGYTGDPLDLNEKLAAQGYLTEERLHLRCGEVKVSGAFDALEGGMLIDYKVTSTWSVLGEAKPEWVQQLNLLRYLALKNGLDVEALTIIAVLRDWTKIRAKTDRDYPQAQVVAVRIPLWTPEATNDFLQERLALHFADSPPPCTPEERWYSGESFAVMKDGRKSAVKLHETRVDAANHCANLGRGHEVVHRPGVNRRCADYCNVSHACPQLAAEAAAT